MEVRKCQECCFYNNSFRDGTVKSDPRKGRCFIYDSVDPLKRNLSQALFCQDDYCRFNLPIHQKEDLSAEQIAEIVNRSPQSFSEAIKPEDIRLEVLSLKDEDWLPRLP